MHGVVTGGPGLGGEAGDFGVLVGTARRRRRSRRRTTSPSKTGYPPGFSVTPPGSTSVRLAANSGRSAHCSSSSPVGLRNAAASRALPNAMYGPCQFLPRASATGCPAASTTATVTSRPRSRPMRRPLATTPSRIRVHDRVSAAPVGSAVGAGGAGSSGPPWPRGVVPRGRRPGAGSASRSRPSACVWRPRRARRFHAEHVIGRVREHALGVREVRLVHEHVRRRGRR